VARVQAVAVDDCAAAASDGRPLDEYAIASRAGGVGDDGEVLHDQLAIAATA